MARTSKKTQTSGKASKSKKSNNSVQKAESYKHPTAESLMRPDVGTQSQFRKKKPPVKYRYDSSLAPELQWDGQNSVREYGEWLLTLIEKATSLPGHKFDAPQEFQLADGSVVATVRTLQEAVDLLKRIGKPFLNWAGKAERLSFDVPTLPLFVHERLSTKAIIETLKGHRKDEGAEQGILNLFGDPQRPIADQVLRAYEYKDKWTNRMILGDSLVVMNSLLHYEGLGGQVQMIYIDPPYGVKFGSNFQPFVRKREVKHNDDADMSREPETVRAYRDTWEFGLHSYLTYLRDRLLLARDLLSDSGSVFVQISDDNIHNVRSVLDQVFGAMNFAGLITFRKSGSQTSGTIPSVADFLLWYAKDINALKFRPLFVQKSIGNDQTEFRQVMLKDGSFRGITQEELAGKTPLPTGSRIFKSTDLHSRSGSASTTIPFEFKGQVYAPRSNAGWRTNIAGLKVLETAGRLIATGDSLRYVHYFDDFPYSQVSSVWDDVMGEPNMIYAVQTNHKVIERCMLMTTDPGDLVLDPTCGGGSTARVAEEWGRRWITIDISRVPLALARQRLLTSTFDFYELRDEHRGPASGFAYGRRQNSKGEETGGIVPHITLKSIANNEPPEEEVLVDRPQVVSGITRVSGPYCVEAMIPTPIDWEGDGVEDSGSASQEEYGSYLDRMLEVLRKSPVLHVGGGKSVLLKSVRQPAKSLSISAEASVEATAPGQAPTLTEAVDEADDKRKGKLELTLKPVAIVFGPENGAVSEKLVYEAAREAHVKSYTHLYVIGFAIQPNARKLVDECDKAIGVPATYVQATPDLIMGDLLKNMRSSQIFSVCGLPEVRLHKSSDKQSENRYQVELLGLDVFDPSTMEVEHRSGDDVPAWFLDTDYNGLCFHVTQAFFPRTSAWDNLKKALKSTYDEAVWDHLAGTESAPFAGGEHGQIAVKVIDDRGNELLVVKKLSEAK